MKLIQLLLRMVSISDLTSILFITASCSLHADEAPSLRLTNVTTSSVKAHLERSCNPSDVLYSTHLQQGDRMVEVDVDLEDGQSLCLVVHRSHSGNLAMGVHPFSFAQSHCEIVIAEDDIGYGFDFASNCGAGSQTFLGL